MTLSRDVSASHIPARLARPPRERRRRLPQAIIFVGFSETQYFSSQIRLFSQACPCFVRAMFTVLRRGGRAGCERLRQSRCCPCGSAKRGQHKTFDRLFPQSRGHRDCLKTGFGFVLFAAFGWLCDLINSRRNGEKPISLSAMLDWTMFTYKYVPYSLACGGRAGCERLRQSRCWPCGSVKREQHKTVYGLLPQSQDQNLASTVLHVPYVTLTVLYVSESGLDCLMFARIWP